MRKFSFMLGAAALAFVAVPAQAQTTTIITPSSQPAGTSFIVGGNINSGSISATFGHAGIPIGEFTDVFRFTIPQTGVGSGAVTTSVNLSNFLGSTDLDFFSVLVNGIAAELTLQDAERNICTVRGVGTCGANEIFAINNVPITAGVLNTITVAGLSRGNGSFGGNATFTPVAPVPEPGTWAMMLLGFGVVGSAMRRRRRTRLIPQAA